MIFSAIIFAAFCLQGNYAKDAKAYYLSCGPSQLNEDWTQFTGLSVENIDVVTTGSIEFKSKDWDIGKPPKDPTGLSRYPEKLYTNFMYLLDGGLSMTFTVTPFVEYSIVMHFIEPKWNQARSFNILLNDYLAPALTEFSVESMTKGVRRPLAVTLNPGMMKSDSFKVTLQPVEKEAILCAIEVFPTGYWREPVPIEDVQELPEVETPPPEVEMPAPAPAPGVLEDDEEYTAPAPALLPLETPDFSKVTKISTSKSCIQVEDPFCGLSNFEQALWTFETSPEAEGCGFMRWGDDNNYATTMMDRFPDIVICYNVDVATDGDYLLEVGGTRTSFGRNETTCREPEVEKAEDRAACAAIEGVECYCSDEENDVWTRVNGPHIDYATPNNLWMKHMMDCNPDTWCKRDIVNYEHVNTPAVYSLKKGAQEVCIAGRSKFVGIDFVCLEYQGPPTLTGEYLPEPEEPEVPEVPQVPVTTQVVDVGGMIVEETHQQDANYVDPHQDGTHDDVTQQMEPPIVPPVVVEPPVIEPSAVVPPVFVPPVIVPPVVVPPVVVP